MLIYAFDCNYYGHNYLSILWLFLSVFIISIHLSVIILLSPVLPFISDMLLLLLSSFNFHFLYVATVSIVSSSTRFLCVITIIIVSITIYLYFYYHYYNRHYLPVMLCVLIPITVVVISIQFFSHYYHCCRRYSHSIIFSLLLGLLSLSPITSFIISVSL